MGPSGIRSYDFVDARPADAEAARDLSGTNAVTVQALDGLPVDRAFAALVDALGLGSLNAGALALLDEGQFHLSHHRQGRKDYPALRLRRIDLGLQHA